MKKRILAVCVCIICGAVHMNGQTGREDSPVRTEGGVKADVTFFNFQKKAAPGAVSRMTPGLALGGFMNIWFNDRVGIRPELNINFKQTVFGWEQNSGKMQSFGIEIPIYVTGRVEIFGNHHLYAGIGPYTEFSCYAKWMIDGRKVDLLEIHENSGEPMIQDTQSGFGAVVGYEFGFGLSIDASYKVCCFNILQPNTSQGVSLYPQSISVGLAYKFGKK